MIVSGLSKPWLVELPLSVGVELEGVSRRFGGVWSNLNGKWKRFCLGEMGSTWKSR